MHKRFFKKLLVNKFIFIAFRVYVPAHVGWPLKSYFNNKINEMNFSGKRIGGIQMQDVLKLSINKMKCLGTPFQEVSNLTLNTFKLITNLLTINNIIHYWEKLVFGLKKLN